jgi:hypothetical protein
MRIGFACIATSKSVQIMDNCGIFRSLIPAREWGGRAAFGL